MKVSLNLLCIINKKFLFDKFLISRFLFNALEFDWFYSSSSLDKNFFEFKFKLEFEALRFVHI